MRDDVLELIPDEHDSESWRRAFEQVRRHTIAGPLDIELRDIGDESLELAMPITDAARQPFGLLHGGVSMVLAETAASFHACWGVDLAERMPVGTEINGSHLDSARSGHVRALATVLRRGHRTIVHEVEVVHERGDELCRARVTNLYVHPDST